MAQRFDKAGMRQRQQGRLWRQGMDDAPLKTFFEARREIVNRGVPASEQEREDEGKEQKQQQTKAKQPQPKSSDAEKTG